MIKNNTPIEDHIAKYGLWVKREDLCCPPPGPPFSKTRGVYAHLKKRPEKIIGVLDTYHSQAGWAVSQACKLLGKLCINYYPEYKYEPGWRNPQDQSRSLGARLVSLQAGRSAVLYHQAKKHLAQYEGSYMMPNALKLEDMVEETAKEFHRTRKMMDKQGIMGVECIMIPISSATIATGVIKGILESTETKSWRPTVILHLGYSRSEKAVLTYIAKHLDLSVEELTDSLDIHLIDEKYNYKDTAPKNRPIPEWPCNRYYDLKTFQWWIRKGYMDFHRALMWNIG